MKSVRRLLIKTWENSHIHFDGEMNDYTLCGLDTNGDEHLGISIPVEVTKKVDCPTCIQIVRLCQRINNKEYKTK